MWLIRWCKYCFWSLIVKFFIKMKTNVFFSLLLSFGLLFVGCKKEDLVVLKNTSYQIVGLQSEFTYNYLPYSADSVKIAFHLDTIGGGVIPCDQVQLLLGDTIISEIDTLPTIVTCQIPLLYDSIFQFVHRCYVDTNYCSSLVPIYIYKGEVVTPNHYVYEIKFPFLIYVTGVTSVRKDPLQDFWGNIVEKYDL